MIVTRSSEFTVRSNFSDPVSYASLPNLVSILIHCIPSFCWTNRLNIPFPILLIWLSDCHLNMVDIAMFIRSWLTLPKHKISSLHLLFIDLFIWVKEGFCSRTIIKIDALLFKCIHPDSWTVKSSSFTASSSPVGVSQFGLLRNQGPRQYKELQADFSVLE